MLSPDSTSTSLTASASTLSNGSTSTFLATIDPTLLTVEAFTPPPGRSSLNGEISTLSTGMTSTFLAAMASTTPENSWKELSRSRSSENLWTENNCASKHRPWTPKKRASLPSMPQTSSPETKTIAFTSRYVKSSFSTDSTTSISPNIRVFDSSSFRTSFSPVKRLLDLSVKSGPVSPARIHDSPTKRIHLSPAEGTTTKSESQFAIPSTCEPSTPRITYNREAPSMYPVGETLDVVQTSADQTIKNIIERFEYSAYANRGNNMNVFEKDANDLLRTLPKNIAYKCIDFVLRFLEQASVLVQRQDIIWTKSLPRRRTTSNLIGNGGTPTRNLVNEALLVVKTSANQALTRIFGRAAISRFAVSSEFENDESVDFGDETSNLLMRLPENIAYECKGFILYFLDQAVNAAWTR